MILGLGVALLASVTSLAGMTPAHAATVAACEGDLSWTIANSIVPSQISGQLLVISGECADVDSNGLPFDPLTTFPAAGTTLGYTFQGNCAEGFISFANGQAGIFLGGLVVWESQANGSAGAGVGVAAPSGVPCEGAAGSTMQASGPAAFVND